jgi:enoyl-CoA hydratase
MRLCRYAYRFSGLAWHETLYAPGYSRPLRRAEGMRATISGFAYGEPLNQNVMVGPMVNEAACKRVQGMIVEAKAQNAGRFRAGGNAQQLAGNFVEPTLIAETDPNSRIAMNEVFGPVLCVFKFRTEVEAVALANATAYGLSAYVQTNDLNIAQRMARALNAGTVYLNKATPTYLAASPFGGVGLSRFGREGGKAGWKSLFVSKASASVYCPHDLPASARHRRRRHAVAGERRRGDDLSFYILHRNHQLNGKSQMFEKYSQFPNLLFERPAPYVLRITLNDPAKSNALTPALHHQIEHVWAVVDADPETRCTILTGAGKNFCAGGATGDIGALRDPDPAASMAQDFQSCVSLVNAFIDSKKPIISAINGAAVGAGLALALLADISIAASTAKLFDGHVRMGVVAGDHAALIWPLLCGMAKTKYFLLTNEPMTGEQAERHNLVSVCVPPEKLADKAVEVATKIAASAPTAVRMTKYVLNHWLRQQRPIFELSAALEMINFQGRESSESIAAFMEKRPAVFESEGKF